jgi:UDP-N-acetylmuramate dehydrogenase
LKLIEGKYPNVVSYKINENKFKIAAGWMIEKAGWKGKKFNNFGVHENQALVLVNYGLANGKEIFNLSEKIILDIKEKFGITLEREVNII